MTICMYTKMVKKCILAVSGLEYHAVVSRDRPLIDMSANPPVTGGNQWN